MIICTLPKFSRSMRSLNTETSWRCTRKQGTMYDWSCWWHCISIFPRSRPLVPRLCGCEKTIWLAFCRSWPVPPQKREWTISKYGSCVQNIWMRSIRQRRSLTSVGCMLKYPMTLLCASLERAIPLRLIRCYMPFLFWMCTLWNPLPYDRFLNSWRLPLNSWTANSGRTLEYH